MTINATAILQVQLTGNGLGQGGNPFLSWQSSANTNAPPPGFYNLTATTVSLVMPPSTAGTTTGVLLLPPPVSSNAKTVKGASGDTGLANWTNQAIVIPATAGETIYVLSAGVETLQAAFF